MRTSRRARSATAFSSGFTLLEVLAGVLILGLLYTVLATAAMRGLQSEGRDRRRAEASLIADRELAQLENGLTVGLLLENGIEEREEPPYRITVEIAPEDVMAMLPQEVRDGATAEQPGELATLLITEEGESRVQRLSVAVSWEEGFETESVARTSYGFDQTGLEDLLPDEGATEIGSETDGTDGTDDGDPQNQAEFERMVQESLQRQGL